ncbi:MAG TPA: amylo-alpha-1,6-glucosidase [Kofleriaceae bacterium]|nr:amylo-alpha-1,6-glucosidase [Kofleriaceae bacterium]
MNDPREWLEPDGLGGFAMGCADGIRTRRYHGLLLAATRPPEGRMLLVADLEVWVETAGGRFALSSHRYRGDVIHPDGAAHLVGFGWDAWPLWTWRLPDGTEITCELAVAHGAPHVALQWRRVRGDGPATLTVRPLLAGRDYHALHHENSAFRFDAEVQGDRVTWRPYDGVPAIAARGNGRYEHAPDWYRHFVLVAERERGLDCEEDLATPGAFAFELAAGPARLAFAAADGANAGFGGEPYRAREPDPLRRAAAQYLVARGPGVTDPRAPRSAAQGGQTVIAGYPWFADWGRDTFISLRGLCLETGQLDTARRILLEWAGAVSEGMLPNRYGEHDARPEYNTVDAALWFAIAADAYTAAAGPERALDDAIAAIVAGYARGTRHRIAGTGDGLLACGEPGVQLTWMDAKVGDDVITPRIGKPVEIQALWLNALAIAGRRDARWLATYERGRAAFVARFWDGELGQLHDVVDADHVAGAVDRTCRPNQMFAVGGLPLVLLDDARARAVVDRAFAQLWTPAGPRSLAPGDPRYRGRYTGDGPSRDRCYHNGPVWPWLAGAFVEAWLRVRGGTPAAKREARTQFVEPLLARRELAGLGHLPEICDGDAPHAPRGCPFQAWSLAEALRIDALTR